MRLALLALSALVLAGISVGCSSDERVAATTTGPADTIPAEFVVLSNVGRPPGCKPEQVGRLIDDFAKAWTEGDWEAAEALLAPPSHGNPANAANADGEYDFRWFVIGVQDRRSRLVHTMNGPGEVGGFIQERHFHNDRLRPLAVQVRGGRKGQNVVYGRFAFERSADDIESAVAAGQYSVNCGSGTIYFWSLWIDPSEGTPDELIPCMQPSGWTREDERILAC
jgi:hypothetical protein